MDEKGRHLKAALAGRYAVDDQIGSGGMATVYLADDLKHHRQVAMKVLRPELAAAFGADAIPARDRHRRAAVASRISSRSSIPGRPTGMLYYVAPYVRRGRCATRLQQRGASPLADALRHRARCGRRARLSRTVPGFVHRDVKPENILFADGHAVLADFGIARALSAAAPRRSPTAAWWSARRNT